MCSKVDSAGRILKQTPPLAIPDPSVAAPDWKPGSNAIVHYSAWTYITEEEDTMRKQLVAQAQGEGHCFGSHHHDSSQEECASSGMGHSDHKQVYPYRHKVGDSRRFGEPLEVRIGRKFVFQGLEQCLRTLRVKERSMFVLFQGSTEGYVQIEANLRQEYQHKSPKHCSMNCPSSSEGQENPVSAHRCSATLTPSDYAANWDLLSVYSQPLELELELIDFQAPGTFDKGDWELSVEDRWNMMQKKKEEGNSLCSKGLWSDAKSYYEEALQFLNQVSQSSTINVVSLETQAVSKNNEAQSTSSRQPEDFVGDNGSVVRSPLSTQLSALHSNLALVHMKMNPPNHSLVVHHANKCLEQNSNSIKGLCRRAAGYRGLGEWDQARKDLQRAIELELSVSTDKDSKLCGGSAKVLLTELHLVDIEERRTRNLQKKMFGGIFK
ncbi:hypothetical protein M427DRAFT_142105 [Gonapodya prolifera JEL478]|uniref:peptidylprolyl isomerase n=1 Tax=Gonapodya prolifera (strain JEL478) TaxID=1344416 RepID=A0A139AY44_GONPJ|nr:hypothetical protein M427DRAFT_142105 [Gonapodya prolifera JEL478]|eukprot:KXS21671.1 hypothetical protein M427DRAFT_142105 [Gonapodya prolifera JEL478]